MSVQLIAQASLAGILIFGVFTIIAARTVNKARAIAYGHPHDHAAVNAYAQALTRGIVAAALTFASVIVFAASIVCLTLA